MYEFAARQGSLISLNELIPLLPERTTEQELLEALRNYPALGSRFELRSGYLTEKNTDKENETLLGTEGASRNTAVRNIWFATRFVPLMHYTPFSVVAVSGSTSYLSASHSKDLDLFCVAQRGWMWLSLTQALIFARVFSLLRRDAPQICFSCVMDEGYAETAFTRQQDPLFARDALATIVLKGRGTYQSLIGRASWISSLYPAAYSTRRLQAEKARFARWRPSTLQTLIDRFLYVAVGSFIRMKASILNRKLASHHRSRVFAVRAAHDHLIYESARYSSLRGAYGAVLAE